MEATKASSVCFSLFIRSNYSSVEFNYFFFAFLKYCSMEGSSHLSGLHLVLSGSKGGFLHAVLTIIIKKNNQVGDVWSHLCNDVKHSSRY